MTTLLDYLAPALVFLGQSSFLLRQRSVVSSRRSHRCALPMLCRVWSYMVTKQTVAKKKVFRRFYCTVFFRLGLNMTQQLTCLGWADSFSLNLEVQTFTRFELSQSRNIVLKRHFTLSCIYYSVIPAKTLFSLLALEF